MGRIVDAVGRTGSDELNQRSAFSTYSLFVTGGVVLDEELLLSEEVLAGLSVDFLSGDLPSFLSEDLPSPSAEAFIEDGFEA
jgi:hypothetical protein